MYFLVHKFFDDTAQPPIIKNVAFVTYSHSICSYEFLSLEFRLIEKVFKQRLIEVCTGFSQRFNWILYISWKLQRAGRNLNK